MCIRDSVFTYDYLILAVGSASHFYGVRGAAEHAYELKTLEQAIVLRNHILRRFERALCETDAQKRGQMLTFTVVGGGPTGIEFAGALAELIRGPLVNDYPALNFGEVHILLLEAADRLLTGLPERLHTYALKRLQRQGVEVRLASAVSQITSQTVSLKGGIVIPPEYGNPQALEDIKNILITGRFFGRILLPFEVGKHAGQGFRG